MKQKTRRRWQNAGIIVLIILGFSWITYKFVGFTSSTYTDNAQVYQRIVPVNSRISGFVKEVRFDDYTTVHKGDTLVIVEDADFRLQLAQAKASLQNALSGLDVASTAINTATNDITVNDAALDEAKVLLDNARKDRDRYAALLQQDAVTQQQYDRAETDYLAAKARYDRLARQKSSTGLIARQQTQRRSQNEAGIEVAQAAVALAELNLSYTIITAPCDGVASRCNIQAGQLIQPGQTLLTVVDTADTWIIANYKETQTSRMAVGDSVRITVDAVKDVKYSGYIEAIANATGSKYSPVPQDNATGNFIKVEQRIPIKIRFAASTKANDMARLRSGMNVECKVRK
jgi:membrane fusion protein (multidrug efflux system)